MVDLNLSNECKQLSGEVYNDNKFKIPKGYIKYDYSQNVKTGFFAKTYIKNGTMVIAFRGSESTNDFAND